MTSGTRSLSRRSSSNDVEPEPTTMAARSTVAGTAASRNTRSTSRRERRWSERSSPGGMSPDRYTTCPTPARSQAAATRSAASRSLVTKSSDSIECTR